MEGKKEEKQGIHKYENKWGFQHISSRTRTFTCDSTFTYRSNLEFKSPSLLLSSFRQ